MGQTQGGIKTGCLPKGIDSGDFALTQYGTVVVRVSSLGSNRRINDRNNLHLVGARGTIFHGSSYQPSQLCQAIEDINKYRPKDIILADTRAHQLLVIYTDGWYAIPSLEIFSRHSGTCVVIGDRKFQGRPYPMKLGDCFRLGSVGLVVSEMKSTDGTERRLDTRHLQYLREEALAFDTEQEEACLAATEGEELRDGRTSPVARTQVAMSERFICYMCYETHDTPNDQLVAPCDCKGDTRYLHVQCLQKWYQTSVCGPRAQVIRTTGNGAPACKICGAAYKTVFRNSKGQRVSLLEIESGGPYLSLVVVTKHDTSPGLFNTKFRLNFGFHNPQPEVIDLNDPPGALSVGRSSSCQMILDYRTVSTIHAKIFCQNNEFFIQDSRSSNGTMAYLQEPLPLHFSRPVRIRMGRSTLTLQARRNWTASLRGVFLRPRPRAPPAATAFALSQVMGTATNTGVGSYGNLEHPDGHHGAANNNNRVTLAAANSHPNFGNVTFPPAYTAAHSGGGVMLRPVAVRADGGMLANMSLAEDSKEDEDSRGPSTRPSTEVPNQNGVRSVSRSFRVASLAPVLSSSVRQAAGDATKAENSKREVAVTTTDLDPGSTSNKGRDRSTYSAQHSRGGVDAELEGGGRGSNRSQYLSREESALLNSGTVGSGGADGGEGEGRVSSHELQEFKADEDVLELESREGARSLQQSSRVSTPEGRVNRHGIGAASGGASELIPDGPFEVSSNHNNVVSLGDKSTICVHDTEKWE